jgi:hypothetical protein
MPLAPPLPESSPIAEATGSNPLGKGSCRIPPRSSPHRGPERPPRFDSRDEFVYRPTTGLSKSRGPPRREAGPGAWPGGEAVATTAPPRAQEAKAERRRRPPGVSRRRAGDACLDRSWPPARGCEAGGSRAVSPRGRVSRRHLNRGRGPLQEGGAFPNRELVNPRGGTASGRPRRSRAAPMARRTVGESPGSDPRGSDARAVF